MRNNIATLQEMELNSAIVLFLVLVFVKGELCPKQCDCDRDKGLNRATCVDQNIIGIEVGVPNGVQVYSLSHNLISELDNFCFKEAGYLSLQVLNLSYNVIFWIGLHAFADLHHLVHLDLSNNRLRYIPSDLFWDTPQLSSLDLSSNLFETLKNEPFLMHDKLQILNLNDCRMKDLPIRMFTKLTNLKKLDISENYLITLDINVLRPLEKLERLELKSYFMKCNAAFMALETWIVSRRIQYQKRCKLNTDKMPEKMISLVPVEKEDVDVSRVWNITMRSDNIVPPTETKVLTPYEKFDRDFSSVQAFIIGVEIGLAIGVVGTYVWLRKFCHCGQLDCTRLRIRPRQVRRAPITRESDLRTNLLWSNLISHDTDTPPSYRRQPPNGTSVPYGARIVMDAGLQLDAIRLPDRPETPPPPYNECRINI